MQFHPCVIEQAYAAIYDHDLASAPASSLTADDFLDADDLLEEEASLENVTSEDEEMPPVTPIASSSKRKRR